MRQDAREFLARAGRRFTLCVLDPPSFSTRAGAPPIDVQRDHRELIESALSTLLPRGVLYFSTNHQRFEPRLQQFANVTEISKETVPVDYRNDQVHRCFRIAAP